MTKSTASLQVSIKALAQCSRAIPSPRISAKPAAGFCSPRRPTFYEHATSRSAFHIQPRLALSTHSSNRRSRSSKTSATYALGISGLSIASILFAVYTGDPLRTDASKEPEQIEGTSKSRKIRLKELKQHGADCPDGIWVSRGVSSVMLFVLHRELIFCIQMYH
jgi:hypothetical protein